jgi:hypothetical protein
MQVIFAVHAGYIAVHAGYIPVHAGYMAKEEMIGSLS